MPSESLFARAGGADSVRAIISEFVHLMVNDVMIGFFFNGVDQEQLAEREYQFTARFLGAEDQPYGGRALRAAHAAHRIMGGQFDRRRQILKQVLQSHRVPADVMEAWLRHVDEMRTQVTRDGSGECD